ncbi:MAG: metal-dependent transcriptional regulator [Peptococcia bacterium]
MQSGLSLSDSLQDYLEGILNLSEQNERVRITDLANHLGITKPSATNAVQTLVKMGLLNQDKYGPLELTESGLKIAKEVRRRHETLKEFLTDVLEVNPEIAENEACLLEHAISLTTLNKLIAFLESYKQSN